MSHNHARRHMPPDPAMCCTLRAHRSPLCSASEQVAMYQRLTEEWVRGGVRFPSVGVFKGGRFDSRRLNASGFSSMAVRAASGALAPR